MLCQQTPESESESDFTGSGPKKGMPVFSAARQRGSSSGLARGRGESESDFTGSGPTKGVSVFRAARREAIKQGPSYRKRAQEMHAKGVSVFTAARQRGSSSGLGAVTKGTLQRTVLSHRIPTPPRQPGRARVQVRELIHARVRGQQRRPSQVLKRGEGWNRLGASLASHRGCSYLMLTMSLNLIGLLHHAQFRTQRGVRCAPA
eukprot:189887-Chlamydomonas_euryale.AAC.3